MRSGSVAVQPIEFAFSEIERHLLVLCYIGERLSSNCTNSNFVHYFISLLVYFIVTNFESDNTLVVQLNCLFQSASGIMKFDHFHYPF